MIEIRHLSSHWGVDPLPEDGAKINILDEESGIITLVPFDGESLPVLVAQLYFMLTDEQKKKVDELLSAATAKVKAEQEEAETVDAEATEE